MAVMKNASIGLKKIPFLYQYYTKDCVFFDIETTGLHWKTSHVYLIGAACVKEDTWQIRQWFLDRPFEEKEFLREFAEYLSSFEKVVHYNGSSFDIPYLSHKYDFYQLENPFTTCTSVDLYRELAPCKKLFSLPHMKQRDMEEFLHIHRKDPYGGGDLIPVYQTYLSTADTCLLEALYLHNFEDITGMLQLLPMLSYPQLRMLDPSISVLTEIHCRLEDLCLYIDCQLPYAVPHPLRLQHDFESLSSAVLSLDGRHLALTITGCATTMKVFFSNYKDYYYLPLEDTIVHKSVAAYVDTSYKEKAKASNCYLRKEGVFFPQPESCITPAFYPDTPRGTAYFSADPQKDPGDQITAFYIAGMLRCMMK